MPTLADKNQWTVQIVAAIASGSASFQETSAIVGDTLHADFTWQDALINDAGSSAYYCAMAIINPDNEKPAYYREYDNPDGSKLLEWVTDRPGTWTAQIDVWDGNDWITYMEPITVYPVSEGLCSWIDDLGGATAISTNDVLYIMRARLGLETPEFTVSTIEVLGVMYYRLGLTIQGNNATGCDF